MSIFWKILITDIIIGFLSGGMCVVIINEGNSFPHTSTVLGRVCFLCILIFIIMLFIGLWGL